MSSSGASEKKRKASPEAAAAAAVVTSVIDLTQQNDSDEDNDNDSSISNSNDTEEDDEEERMLHHQRVATCEVLIVGIRYYSGTVHPGEYVSLVREPHNPYDPNAIRVDNMQGDKVGHIKATQAKLLTPFLDDDDDDDDETSSTIPSVIVVNAIIPRRGNAYTIPCSVEFVVACDTAEDVPSRAYELAQNLARALKSSRALNFQSLIPLPSSSDNNQNKARKVPTTVVEHQVLDWTKQAQQLDKMFEQQLSQQLKNLPTVKIPDDNALRGTTTLLDYQYDGLKWLVYQDTVDQIPFFRQIQENGQQVWYCEISNASQTTAPKSFRGGILADEMGLYVVLGDVMFVFFFFLVYSPFFCSEFFSKHVVYFFFSLLGVRRCK